MLDSDNCLLLSLAMMSACWRQVAWHSAVREEVTRREYGAAAHLEERSHLDHEETKCMVVQTRTGLVCVFLVIVKQLRLQFRRGSLLLSLGQKKKTPQLLQVWAEPRRVADKSVTQQQPNKELRQHGAVQQRQTVLISAQKKWILRMKKKKKTNYRLFNFNIYTNG